MIRWPSRELVRQVFFYGTVGVIGTSIDVGLLWVFLWLKLTPVVAVTLAYFTATAVQFFLNRHWSFRAFDRAAIHQFRAYVVVVLANWFVAVAFVEGGIHLFGLPPLVAKALSIPPSFAVGFLGNRYLTFGPGIRATYRRLILRK